VDRDTPVSRTPTFAPIKNEFRSLYSGFKGRVNKGVVSHALSRLDSKGSMVPTSIAKDLNKALINKRNQSQMVFIKF
jgi:hypothetical protein